MRSTSRCEHLSSCSNPNVGPAFYWLSRKAAWLPDPTIQYRAGSQWPLRRGDSYPRTGQLPFFIDLLLGLCVYDSFTHTHVYTHEQCLLKEEYFFFNLSILIDLCFFKNPIHLSLLNRKGFSDFTLLHS